MADELIDRVAQAIYEASGQPVCGVPHFSEHVHAAIYRAMAEAAIAAIQETHAIFTQTHDRVMNQSALRGDAVAHGYDAMIAAAPKVGEQ